MPSTQHEALKNPGMDFVFFIVQGSRSRNTGIIRRANRIENPEETLNAGNPERSPIALAAEGSPPDAPPPPVSFSELKISRTTKASLGKRFFALAIDYVILEIFSAFATLPFEEKFSGALGKSSAMFSLRNLDQLTEIATLFFYYCLTCLTLWGFYFTFFHWMTGQTIGKKIFNIQVVKMDGSPLDFLDALGRWIGFMIGLSFFGLGLLWAVFNKEGRAWHDKVMGTMVIRRNH